MIPVIRSVLIDLLTFKKKKKDRISNVDSSFSSITISRKEEKSIISFDKKNYSFSFSE